MIALPTKELYSLQAATILYVQNHGLFADDVLARPCCPDNFFGVHGIEQHYVYH
jgi:hypothetical protein